MNSHSAEISLLAPPLILLAAAVISVPMARFATPDDVASAIAFLADEKASGFINGHSLAVDGGWTCDGSWESLRLSHR